MPRGLIICWVKCISFNVIPSVIMSDWPDRKFSSFWGCVLFLFHHFLPVKDLKPQKTESEGQLANAVCLGKARDSLVPRSCYTCRNFIFLCICGKQLPTNCLCQDSGFSGQGLFLFLFCTALCTLRASNKIVLFCPIFLV